MSEDAAVHLWVYAAIHQHELQRMLEGDGRERALPIVACGVLCLQQAFTAKGITGLLVGEGDVADVAERLGERTDQAVGFEEQVCGATQCLAQGYAAKVVGG